MWVGIWGRWWRFRGMIVIGAGGGMDRRGVRRKRRCGAWCAAGKGMRGFGNTCIIRGGWEMWGFGWRVIFGDRIEFTARCARDAETRRWDGELAADERR